MRPNRLLLSTLTLSVMLSGGAFARPTTPVKPAMTAKATASAAPKNAKSVSDADLRSVSRLKRILAGFQAQEARDADADEAKEKADKTGKAGSAKKATAAGEENDKHPDYLDAYLYYLEQRAFPNDMIDEEAMYRATLYRRAMRPFTGLTQRLVGGGLFGRALAVARPVVGDNPGTPARPVAPAIPVAAQWQFIGPRNLSVPYTTYYGPYGSAINGRVNAIAFHPTDSNTAYLATGGGGVWKTGDGGANWACVSGAFPSQNTGSVAVDSNAPNTVYVGLGDFQGYRGTGGGIEKSTDGGANWTALDAGNIGAQHFSAIAIDPDNHQRIVASGGRSGVSGNLYLSTNGGANWTTTSTATGYWDSWSDLKISPLTTGAADATQPSKRFYFSCRDRYYTSSVHGIWRSVDRGQAWQQITNVPDGGSQAQFYQVAPSSVDPNVVYVLATGDQKIYQGVRNPATDTYTWTDYSTGFTNGTGGTSTYNWSQHYYDVHLEAVKQNVAGVPSDVLYNGLITISGKRGANAWQDLGLTFANGTNTHNDQHAFAAFPGDTTKMLFGNDGGVYGMNYSDTGANGTYTFATTLNKTLGATMFYYGDFHPTNPTITLGGAQDNASPAAFGDLANWQNPGAGDGGGSVINPLNPNLQYTTYQNGGFYSTINNWVSQSYGMLPMSDGPFVARLAVDPNYPNPVYFGGTNYLHRYNDPSQGGSGWETKLGGYSFGSQLLAITVAPSDSRVLYVGTKNGAVYVSANYGTSWANITTGLPSRSITDFWVNPANPADAIVTLSGTGAQHVYRTANGTSVKPTWTAISGSGGGALPDIPTNCVTRDPFDPSGKTFYVGTDIGVFATADGGTTWQDASVALGFPNVQVSSLKAVSGTGYLMAATYGRGMWRIPLTTNLPDLVPDVRPTYSVTKSQTDGSYTLTVTINNVGGAAANPFAVTTATIRVNGVTTNAVSLPAAVTIGPNATQTITIKYPASVGASGASGIIALKANVSYGSKTVVFGTATRVTLP